MSWWIAWRTDNLALGNTSSLILIFLIAIIAVLQRIMVFGPLNKVEKFDETTRRAAARPFLYFAGIGVGFMCVELALLQRFAVFLGHPSYGLSVVLFTLLLLGGVGSSLSSRIKDDARVRWVLTAVIVGIAITAVAVPAALGAMAGVSHTMRIVAAIGFISPLALVMGMAFPLGIRRLEHAGHNALIPWAWAVNGVAGVFATAFGMLTAMTFGYTWLLMLGALSYLLTIWSARD